MTGSSTLRVFRYDPDQSGATRYDNFGVPVSDQTTVLDALAWIQNTQDPTLAFRYSCRVGMCGTCAMVVNGRERWTCRTRLIELESKTVTVRPLYHFPLVKDLVVDMAPFQAKLQRVDAAMVPAADAQDFALISPQSDERQVIDPAIECIACGACVSACTMVGWQPAFPGPAALLRASTLIEDGRDQEHERRLAGLLTEEALWHCHTQLNCTAVCPMALNPADAITRLKRRAMTAMSLRPSAPEQSTPPGEPGPTPDTPRRRRPVAVALGVSLAAGLLYYLTMVSALSTPRPNVFQAPPGPLSPKLMAGMVLYEENGCASCHSILGKGMRLGPDLYRIGAKREREWLTQLLKDPASVFPSPSMPSYSMQAVDLEALVAYLASLDLTRGVQQIPRPIVAGGSIIYRQGCLGCHRLAGEGQEGGIPLGGRGRQRDEKWLVAFLRSGGGHPPLAVRPSSDELRSVTRFLRSLDRD